MELLINIFTTVDEIDPHNRKPLLSWYRDLMTFQHIIESHTPAKGSHHYSPIKTFLPRQNTSHKHTSTKFLH